MGFSKKSQVESGLDSDGKKWVIAGISIRASLKPIKTKLKASPEIEVGGEIGDFYDDEEKICSPATPTANESKIPEKLKCPPAPRKRRPALKFRSNGVKDYFIPPSDLETVFIKRR